MLKNRHEGSEAVLPTREKPAIGIMPNIAWSLPRRLARLDAFDLASGLLIAGLVIIALMTFRDYGISNDEEVQHRYGELIIAYYSSGFSDQTLFHFKNLYLYGGLFDILAVLLTRLLPFDLFLIRHLLSAAIGIGGIAATAATARLIAGPRAGFIAAAALAICGPWFGGMFNHTKDVPFAAAMMAAIYFLLRATRELPRPRWGDILGFGLTLGAALGLRATALLLFGYAVIAIVLGISWRPSGFAQGARFFLQSIVRFIPAFVVGYAIMIAAWPWASLDPFNPLRAIFSFAHFHYQIRTIIAGKMYDMADVPWWYVPGYLLIKLPIFIFVGALCALVFAAFSAAGAGHDARRGRETAFVALTILFPLCCEMIAEGPAFDGLRHFMFVIPPLAVLCGIGFDALLVSQSGRRRWLGLAAHAALAAVMIWNASVLVRLHPYESLFYNQFVGGLEGAARRYVMDYWLNMLPEAVRDLADYLDRTEPNAGASRTFTVGICGERFAFETYADKRMKWSRWWLEADFYISPTHMNCDGVIDGKVIATIERMGVAIGVVKDHRGSKQAGL